LYPNLYPEGATASAAAVTTEPKSAPPAAEAGGGGGGGGPVVTSGGGGDDGGDDDEEGMLRMSFLEHLEELRSRILKALAGIGVAFVLSLIFANEMWTVVSAPAMQALKTLGFANKLVQITPMETFTTVWVKLPMLASVFLGSPWVLYQVWAFIAPGLYRRERRWAAPFVICSAGLFITGGLFAYFIAFRYGLTFLLGIGRDINIQPMVSVTEYFDLFVNVMLGIGLVFELPVLIFFLTLLRIVTPGFLIRHSRYAILIIVIIAAVVTPTPDVFNLMLFAVPMCLLFYVGIFGGYILVLHREQRRFPWGKVLPWVALALAVIGAAVWLIAWKYGLHFVWHWPFLTK
jgi:sec-independent protein translocase protein TatC